MLMRSVCLAIVLVAPSFAEEDFYKSLMALTTPSKKVPKALQDALESKEHDPLESLGGVKFGMSMTEVVKVWGKPNFIWMQLDDITQLDIKACHFKFKRDKLVGITIHSAALPGLKLKNGLTFTSTEADIKQKYPSARLEEMGGVARILSVELKSGHTLRFQFGMGKLIAITTEVDD